MTLPTPQPTPAVRLLDWQSRLAALVEAHQATPFAWGEHDCCLWAAACAGACTGTDPAAELRGTYTDQRGARAVLSRLGGLAVLAAQCLGGEIQPAFAQAGDVGLVVYPQEGEGAPEGVGEQLAVWLGSHWAAPGADGLVTVRPELVARAWRLCHG